MTTTTKTGKRPPAWQIAVLKFWHSVLAGGFLVAYVTADDSFYGLHLFAGSVVLLTVLLRVFVGLMFTPGAPLALPQAGTVPPGRNPLNALMAVVVIGSVGVSGLSGWMADGIHAANDLHEGLSQLAAGLALAHVALVVMLSQGRRIISRP